MGIGKQIVNRTEKLFWLAFTKREGVESSEYKSCNTFLHWTEIRCKELSYYALAPTNFREMAASYFVNVSEEEIFIMNENAIPRNTKHHMQQIVKNAF